MLRANCRVGCIIGERSLSISISIATSFSFTSCEASFCALLHTHIDLSSYPFQTLHWLQSTVYSLILQSSKWDQLCLHNVLELWMVICNPSCKSKKKKKHFWLKPKQATCHWVRDEWDTLWPNPYITMLSTSSLEPFRAKCGPSFLTWPRWDCWVLAWSLTYYQILWFCTCTGRCQNISSLGSKVVITAQCFFDTLFFILTIMMLSWPACFN